jgi:hypothetical protein
MDRKATDESILTISPVPRALAKGSNGPGTSVVFSNAIPPIRDVDAELGVNSVGDRQKSSDHDFEVDETEASDPFLRTSMIRRGARGNLEISSGIRDVLTGWNATDGSFTSSRTSLIVKAA